MEKRAFVWVLALCVSLTVTPASGVEYGKDFLEPGNPGGWSESLKTFDEEWTVSPGGTFDVDIWINDLPEKLITAGFFIDYAASQVSVVSCDVYDGSLPGPWDNQMTNKIENPTGPGTYMVVVGNLSSVLPDAQGDIPIARIKFRYTSPGDAAVTFHAASGFDTVVGDSSTVYDSGIAPNTVMIYQGQGTSSTTSTSTIPPATTTTSIVVDCGADSDCPDDGLYCNGDEFCDDENAICASTGSPCAAELICDEATDECRPAVPAPTIRLTPESWYQSRWVPLIVFLRIEGFDSHFDRSVTEISLTPDSAVLILPLVIDEATINCIGILLPRWWAPVDSIDVTVTTGAEEATETIKIMLLPFLLEQEKNPLWED